MKKLLFTLALFIQTALVFAADNAAVFVRVTTDNVKMYRQAGTSTEVMKSLKSTDEIIVVRKHNANWTIITVDGQAGYVLTSELMQPQNHKSTALVSLNRQK